MAKITDIFSFNGKAAMMVGTCAAALFATSLYIPNTRFEEMPKPAPQAVTAEVGALDSDTATRDVKVPATVAPTVESSDIGTSDAEILAAPKAPVTEIPVTETPTAELKPSENISAPAETITDMAMAEIPIAEPVAERPVAEVPAIEVPASEGPVASEPMIAPPSTSESEAALPSDTVVVERRVLKSPARTMERVAPPISKTETRRVVKTPASTVERSVPAVTKQETRRIAKEDGTFETVTETVLVTPSSVEYVTIPAVYETVEETVVVQEASTELVTIPPVYETVRDTIRVSADGSTEVLASVTIGGSEAVAPAPSPEPAPVSSVSSVSDLLAEVKSESGASAERETAFSSSADEGVIIVTGARRADKGSSRRERRREAAAAKRASADYAAPPPPLAPVVSAPMAETGSAIEADRVVSKTELMASLPPGARIVERAIPAVTKTVSRRVIKTPARTTERTIPAVTQQITARVLTEDGTYKDVTTTIVVQEASTELVTIPATYQTVSETIVVTPSGKDFVIVNADGTVSPFPVVKLPKPQPKPQSGLLTAGDYDDVLNPDLYKVYLDKMLQGSLRGKDLPYVDSNNRINIKVVDSAGQPVPMADVRMRTRNNNRMFSLRTGADGMAYLYPEFDGLERGVRVRVSLNDGKIARKTVSGRMVRKGGDIEVMLDTEAAPVSKLDLLLTIDATGSMGDEMRYLQTELKAIVGRVERANPGIDIRTGLVVYRDVGDDYVVREVPFTDDLDDFREALNSQAAYGGGDMPEAMHTAMQTGLDMVWREDAIKVNLLVADAPPHDRNIDETWDAGLMSRTKGIHIVPLAASGVDKTAEFLMRSMAQITGGRYLFLTDDSGIGNKHAKPTVDCYVVTRLDGLVTRVLSSLIKGERVEPQAGEVIRSVGNYRSGTCAVDQDVIEALPQNANYQKRR